MISTGVLGARLIISVPAAPGRRRSVIIRSKPSGSRLSASSTETASATSYPACCRSLRTAERMMSSSSTIRIRGISRSRPFVRGAVAGIGVWLIGGQAQPYTGSPLALGVCRALDLHVAIVFFNNAVHQRKPKARAFIGRLGGVKRLKYMVQLVSGNAGAFINHFDDSGVAVALSTDPDGTTVWRGIPGIGQQVDEDLHQALFITQYLEVCGAFVQVPQPHPLVTQRQQVDGLFHTAMDADRLVTVGMGMIAGAGKVHQRLQNGRDAPGLLLYLVGGFQNGRIICFQFQVLGQGRNAGDRIANLVGNTGGQDRKSVV